MSCTDFSHLIAIFSLLSLSLKKGRERERVRDNEKGMQCMGILYLGGAYSFETIVVTGGN